MKINAIIKHIIPQSSLLNTVHVQPKNVHKAANGNDILNDSAAIINNTFRNIIINKGII